MTPKKGEKALLVSADKALSESKPTKEDRVVLSGSDKARGESVVEVGDEAILLSNDKAQGRSVKEALIYAVALKTKKFYIITKSGSVIEEYDMDFDPHGTGGDQDIIWIGGEFGTDETYKYTRKPFERVKKLTLEGHTEVGGSKNRIYLAKRGSGLVYAYDGDGSELWSKDTGENVSGIGGDEQSVWLTTRGTPGQIYELNPSNGDTINDTEHPGDPIACGGSENNVYSATNDKIYIHNTDLSVESEIKRSDLGIPDEIRGVGGY